VNYIGQKDLSFTYWSLNPDSGDTGGILQDDWLSVNDSKQELLRGVLSANSFAQSIAIAPSIPQTPNPQPSSPPVVINPTPNPTVPTTGQGQLKVSSNMQSDWDTGFCTSLQVTNQGNSSVRDWQVTFQMNQAAIKNSWNGNFQPRGSQYVVTPMDWGQVIEPGQSQNLGFCANKLGSDYQPRQVSVSMR
jgi:endoglucanase